MISACTVLPKQQQQFSKPNILYIVADDLGYSDIGAFGGEINTPHLDELVNSGRLLTNYHTSTVCAVTRSMLYTGTDHHLVGEGTMGPPNDERKGLPGYEGYLNNHALNIAELLQDAGYHTYIAGKWHLGSKIASNEDKTPDQWGFERSFTLLGGATGNHYGHDKAEDKTYTENGQYVALPSTDLEGKPWYDTNFYTQKLISYIDEQANDGKPFAAFATYTSPHWPIQVPEPWASQYRDVYKNGFEFIRNQRIEKQKKLGLLPANYKPVDNLRSDKSVKGTDNFNKPEAKYINADSVLNNRHDDLDYGTSDKLPTWNQLTPEQQKLQARYMELYAGMVSNLDYNVGKLIQHLKDIGQYENTVIVFHSDNGAEGNVNKSDQEQLNLAGFEYLGRDQVNNPTGVSKTYIRYGWRWAEVSATPFRLVKSFTTEGGTSVPMLVHLPGEKSAYPTLSEFVHVRDIAPTLLDIAGISAPKQAANAFGANGQPLVKYKDRNVYPITGHSFLSHLRGESTEPVHSEPVGEEQYGRTYLKSGQWKLVWTEPPIGPVDGHWQLYNIEQDRYESKDLSALHPEVVKTLYAQWQKYMHDSGGVLAKRPGSTGGLPTPPK